MLVVDSGFPLKNPLEIPYIIILRMEGLLHKGKITHNVHTVLSYIRNYTIYTYLRNYACTLYNSTLVVLQLCHSVSPEIRWVKGTYVSGTCLHCYCYPIYTYVAMCVRM